ncbi:MAG: hypothetical protein WAW73_10875 [Rhodoferax sp.]
MARKFSIPWLRLRAQQSGNAYYYLEIPHSSPKKEIPLGPNREKALLQRQVLLFKHWQEHPLDKDPLINLLLQYQIVYVPLLDNHVQEENLASIKRLIKFFEARDYKISDIDSPRLPTEYLAWRNAKLQLRAKSELSLLKRIVNVATRGWKQAQ